MKIDLDHRQTRLSLAIALSAMWLSTATALDRILEALEELEELPVGGSVGRGYLTGSRLHVAWLRVGEGRGIILIATHERREAANLQAELVMAFLDEAAGVARPWDRTAHPVWDAIRRRLEDEADPSAPDHLVRRLNGLLDLAGAAGITPTRRLYGLAVSEPESRGISLDVVLLGELGDAAALALVVTARCGDDEVVRNALDLNRFTLPGLRDARERHADLNDLVEELTQELYG